MSLQGAGVGGGWGDQTALPDDEDVLAGALAHVAVGAEEDGLVVAGLDGLHLGQGGVHVHAGSLGRRGHGVGIVPPPRADLHRNTVGDAVVPEIGAPGPGGDGDVHRAGDGVEAHLAVPQVDQGTDVAPVVETVDPDQVPGGVHQLVDGVRDVDHEHPGRHQQAFDVVAEAEHGHAPLGGVGADALRTRRSRSAWCGSARAPWRPPSRRARRPSRSSRWGSGAWLRAFLRWRRRWRRSTSSVRVGSG